MGTYHGALTTAVVPSGTRVDIDGMDGGMNSSPKINKTYPTALEGTLTRHEWTEFCTKIDSVLETIGASYRKIAIYRMNSYAIALGGVLVGVLAYFFMEPGMFGGGSFTVQVIICMTAILPFGVVQSCGNQLAIKATNALHQVCTDVNLRSDLDAKFYLVAKNEIACSRGRMIKRSYQIVVTAKRDEERTPLRGGQTVSQRIGMTPSKRLLEELEIVKNIITETEYNAKKMQILAEL